MNAIRKIELRHKARRVLWSFRSGRPKIQSRDVEIGKNVVFGKNVRLSAKKIRIGDGCVIQDNVIIEGEEFILGDYCTIYHNCFFPGGKVQIGHNFWLGTGSIIDGRAGTKIGNNVGIGAQSQLWTHMVFGDVMLGCRFHSEKSLNIGDDVWLAGHNLVSPVDMEDRGLVMLGSLVTKNTKQDKTYAGSPARDITEKVGPQFEDTSIEQRIDFLMPYMESFANQHGFASVDSFAKILVGSDDKFDDSNLFQMNVANRTYKKRSTVMEHYLMRHLLPDIKLVPKV